MVDGEEFFGAVDVGQPHRDFQPEALVDGADGLVGVVQAGVQHRRHVLHRVVGLEVARPVGDEGVADAVGLVEGVPCEGFDKVENFHREGLVEALAGRPGHEVFALLRHQRGDFLAHRLAHDVGGPQGVPGELLQDQQHLVLVDDNAVGLVQQLLEAGVGVGYGGPSVLGVDELVDVFHRPRAVERNHRGDVADVGGLELFDIALHTGAFQLENVGGVAGGQQLVGRSVVQRQGLQFDFDAPARAHQLDGLVQDGKAGEAEEVHLQQAEVGHRVHAELGHHHRAGLVALGRALQGHRVGQRLVGDQHAGGVGADVVDDALQPLRPVHQLADVVIAFDGALEFGADLEGLVQVAGLEGYHAGDAVNVAVAHAQGAPHVAQGSLRAQGAEGDYLGHPVVAVLVDDIVQHLIAPVVLEVHVNVRHLLALHIEEALEDQAVLQWVNVGDAEAVEDDAGRRAAPDAEQDVALADEPDNVPHHQEVVGETGVADDLQLVPQALHGIGRGVGIAAPEALLADLGQVFVGVHAAGRLVAGQVGLAELQRHVAHIGDHAGVGQGFPSDGGGQVGKYLLHLIGALDVVGVILHSQPLFVADGGVGLDADVDVLQVGLVLVDVVSIVGHHQRELGILSEAQQSLVYLLQLRDVLMALEFQVIAVSEQFAIPAGGFDSAFIVAVGQQPWHLGGGAPGEADEAGAELFQQALVDARAVVEALDVGLGHQLHQVAVAGVVAGQQHQVGRAALGGVLFVPAVVCDVDLTADDGLDACVAAGGVKIDHAIEGAVVGDGQRIHAQFAGAVDQLRDAADAVEHTVFGVDVKVSERQAVEPPLKKNAIPNGPEFRAERKTLLYGPSGWRLSTVSRPDYQILGVVITNGYNIT